MLRRIAPLWLVLICALPARAIVLDAFDVRESELPPPDVSGWSHVGRIRTLSAVYLGDGWVITARHVGSGDLVLGESTYPAVRDSIRPLTNPHDAGTSPDLVMFRVDPAPALPALQIMRRPPPPGTPVMMMGYGFGRGAPLVSQGKGGFTWNEQSAKRWGTNVIAQSGHDAQTLEYVTRCFRTLFNPAGSRFEAQASAGDSGGAVFAPTGRGRWQLAGVMISVDRHEGQPGLSSLYGNATNAADLSVYRAEILRITGRDASRTPSEPEAAAPRAAPEDPPAP
jgi:hypothetical protein